MNTQTTSTYQISVWDSSKNEWVHVGSSVADTAKQSLELFLRLSLKPDDCVLFSSAALANYRVLGEAGVWFYYHVVDVDGHDITPHVGHVNHSPG